MANPGNFLKEYYEWSIQDDLDFIKFLHSNVKVFQVIREKNQSNWKIVELCREILFDNAKWVQRLMERIEYARETIKKLG